MSLLKFIDENKIIKRINKSEYGLASCIITKDFKKIFDFIKKNRKWIYFR